MIKTYKFLLLGVTLLFAGSCNETQPEVYYGFTLTIKSNFHNGAYYQIPQPSTLLSVQNNGVNYDVSFLLKLTHNCSFNVNATNVNTNTYSFKDSSITTNVNYNMLGFFETNYSAERYTLAEGAIHFHSLDTSDFHCTFNYKFTYTDSNHVGEPFYTNTIEITNAEVRIKK